MYCDTKSIDRNRITTSSDGRVTVERRRQRPTAHTGGVVAVRCYGGYVPRADLPRLLPVRSLTR